MADPVDQAQRSVIRTKLEDDLFVEAGAGTGKTSELTRRVVQLISGGHAMVSQLAIITFTEAAAAELRERVRERLESTAHASNDALVRDRCRMALGELDEMAMETIHAFARRLLQMHSGEAGLPPVFRVVESTSSQLLWRRRWQEFMSSTLTARHGLHWALDHLLRCAISLGLTVNQLSLLARKFHSSWDQLTPVPELQAPQIDLDSVIKHLDAALSMRTFCAESEDEMARRLDGDLLRWRTHLVQLNDGGEIYAKLDALTNAPSLGKGRGQSKRWGGHLETIRDHLRNGAEERASQLAPARDFALAGLTNLLIQFTLEGVVQRKSTGELEFHDLLVLARNVLRDNRAVLTAVQAKFRHLLVDEFQDTDPLQAAIVDLIVSGPENRLFTVGDPRQSIYRFRGADVAQYEAVKAGVSSRFVELNENFRTAPAVLDWIEDITSGLPGVAGTQQRARLSPGRSGDVQGSVKLLGERHPKGVSAPSVREIEAADVVANIQLAVESGAPVLDGESVRPARYSDVAVLFPTRMSLPALERALRSARIPFRIESRSLIWSTQELRDVVSTLRAIENPDDHISLVASLRSIVFSCGDDDLLRWVQCGGAWDYRKPLPLNGEASPVGAAFAWFKARHETRWWKSVETQIDDLIRERRLYQKAFALPRQREAWHRLTFLSDQAARWVEEGGTTLAEFIAWATLQIQHGADARESIVAEADDDAVRVMTIHAAKGLEFPITAVMGINSKGPNIPSARVIWHEQTCEIRLGNKDFGWESPGFAAAAIEDERQESDEAERLLYVALTRVRDHLFVSQHHATSGAKSLAAKLFQLAQATTPPQVYPEVETQIKPANLLVSPQTEFRLSRSDTVANARKPLSISATGVNKMAEGEPAIKPAIGEVVVGRGERMAFGRAVHWVLEIIDLETQSDLDLLVARVIQDEPLASGRSDEVKRSVLMALESRCVEEAVASGRYWRELFAGAGEGDLVLEGFIDLCYETDRGLVIVDYKTDELTENSGAVDLAKHYRWQLQMYSSLLEQNLNRPVAEVLLLMINPLNSTAVEAKLGPNMTDGELRKKLAIFA